LRVFPARRKVGHVLADETLRTTERLLCRAIDDRRLVTFVLDGCARIGEPHDYGVVDGEPRLFFYQTGGASRSGRPLGWRWASLPKIADFSLLDRQFPGPRPVPSGRRQRWDRIIASVSRPPVQGLRAV
jgi:hypothetical protein